MFGGGERRETIDGTHQRSKDPESRPVAPDFQFAIPLENVTLLLQREGDGEAERGDPPELTCFC